VFLISDDGVTWTQRVPTLDDIDPAFAVSVDAPSATREIGDDLVNPTVTIGYVGTPVAPVTINDGDGALSVADPFASYVYAKTYAQDSPGSKTWTVSANGKTGAASVAWYSRAFYGHAVPATIDETFIEALSDSRLQSSMAQSYAFGSPGAGERLYIAVLAGFADLTTFRDQNNDTFPMSKVAADVAVTNAHGIALTYDVWSSDNFIEGYAFTVTVS
jgi:hypothetical protein